VDRTDPIAELRDRPIASAAARVGRQVRRRVLAVAVLMLLLAAGGIAVWMNATWSSVRTEVQERMLTALAEAAAPMSLLFTEVQRVLAQIAETSDPSATVGSWLSLPAGQGAILNANAQLMTGSELPLPPASAVVAMIDKARATGEAQLSLPFQHDGDWLATAVAPVPSEPGYVAALTFSIKAMLGTWSKENVPAGSSFALLTDSGLVWLRHPFAAELVGADASSGPLFQAMQQAGTAQGIADITHSEESGERMVGWRRTSHFGLSIVAGQSTEDVTVAWWQRNGGFFIGAGAVSLAGVLATLLLGRTLGRQASGREAAIRLAEESEQRFRDMADAASDWFWETDEEGKVDYVSDRVRDASGLAPTWFQGRALADLIDGSANAEHRALFLADLEERRPFRDFVFRMDAGRGRYRWIKASGKPLFDEDERFLGYRGTASDITLAREAEGRAAAAHLRLLRAIENVNEAFALFNKDDRLIMCNGRFRSLHLPGEEDKIQPGMTYADFLELIARKGRVNLEGLSLEAWVERRLRLRALGTTLEQRMAEGTWFRVSDHRTPEGDSIAVFSEITQFKEREAQLIDLAEQKGRRSGEGKQGA
jgi:PAS domain S-box-containing protein